MNMYQLGLLAGPAGGLFKMAAWPTTMPTRKLPSSANNAILSALRTMPENKANEETIHRGFGRLSGAGLSFDRSSGSGEPPEVILARNKELYGKPESPGIDLRNQYNFVPTPAVSIPDWRRPAVNIPAGVQAQRIPDWAPSLREQARDAQLNAMKAHAAYQFDNLSNSFRPIKSFGSAMMRSQLNQPETRQQIMREILNRQNENMLSPLRHRFAGGDPNSFRLPPATGIFAWPHK